MIASALGLICARGGSKGIPRKNLRMLAGRPLLAHAIDAAKRSRVVSRVVVSTEDEEIARVARAFGADVPFMRPAELARDDSPEWLVWQHAIRAVTAESGVAPDIMVSVPATAPLRHSDDIDACVETLCRTDADVVITVTEASRNPYFNMVVIEGDFARLVMDGRGRFTRRQDAPAVFDITTVAYAARARFVLNAFSLFDGRVGAVVIPRDRAVDIDTELDLQMAEFLLTRSGATSH